MPKKYVAAMSLPLFSLTAGCADADPAADAPLVVTSFSVLEDITAQIGGEHIDVQSITPVGAEVHEYDPTPSDVAAATEADLFIANGLGLEEWFEQFVAHGEAAVHEVSDGVETLPVTAIEGHPDDAGDPDSMPTDPHAWLSPTQAQVYVENIEAALSETYPEHAEDFAENAATYREQIEAIAADATSRAGEISEEVFIVSCEGAFSYLAADLGLTEHYLWPLNAEDEGSPRQVEAQIEFVTEHEVPVIFCESTVPPGPQEQVAEATEAELGETLYVDSLSEADGPVPTYLDLLEHNIDAVLSVHE
ncbi:metal ABC transporter solute-binding protein, Zn/Mn family [Nesterenkonia alba]|uniref:metal ABC transporter solute-binding protein, Zn/Mn family n=1 Tax=Nesterenkonia alba TaxID=515814 RepID=UPI000688FF0C|nr:zinc ABC transporter substrate-binding protein [Nesterenkonia alba]